MEILRFRIVCYLGGGRFGVWVRVWLLFFILGFLSGLFGIFDCIVRDSC